MMRTALYFAVMAAAMLGLARLLPGFEVKGVWPAIFASLMLALVNTIVRPVLFVLTFPFTLITLGLFLFVLNALMLRLTAALVPGFDVHGFGTTLLASLLLSAVSVMWKALMHAEPPPPRRP